MRFIGYSVLFCIILGIVYLVPFSFIWSVNTLFSLSIGYTLKNWIASLVLLILIGNGSGIKLKQKKKKCSGSCSSKN
jgi:hypothetical protein